MASGIAKQPVDSSSEESSDDSLDDSLEEDDQPEVQNQGSEQPRQHKPSNVIDELDCALSAYLYLLQHQETFPRSFLLFRAHQQLDTIDTRTQWTIVWQALRSFGPNTSLAVRGDEKCFRRYNRRTVAYRHDWWAASVARLQDRVDTSLTELKVQDDIKSHSNFLSVPERKAFNGCLQIWKKFLRGRCRKTEMPHQLLTSLEASVLCRQDYQPELVICLAGKPLDLSRLRDELESKIHLSSSQVQWKRLDICADSSVQVRSILEVVLSLSNQFEIIALFRHGVKERKGGLPLILPAVLLHSCTLTHIYSFINQDDQQDTFTDIDYRSIVRKLEKERNLDSFFTQPARLSKLGAMSSLVIRKYGMDISALPVHLQESVKTASRCTSCQRIMISGRLLPISSPSSSSLKFNKQASQAGFKVRGRLVHEVFASLSCRNGYLPPLTETFEMKHTSNKVLINGTSNPAEPSDWQFCAACAALHFGVTQSTSDNFCRCIGCPLERSKMLGKSNLVRRRKGKT